MTPVVYQLVLVAAALLLVLLNGFFVASEFSIVKVRETRIDELVGQGSRPAVRARRLLRQMDEYLSATQLGITVASLGLGWIGEPAFAALFEPLFNSLGRWGGVLTHSLAATAAFLLITFLHIVLGELAPKSLAIQRAEQVVLWASLPMILFYKISYPFIWALNGAANLFLRALRIRPVSTAEAAHSEEELRMLLASSKEKGVLAKDKQVLLDRVFDFADRSVRQIMVPSVDVVFLNNEQPLEQNIRIVREHGHTRYPLCRGSLDQVIGLIHIKDLFRRLKQPDVDFDLGSVKRPIQYVPETQYVKALLTQFRQTKTHLAAVVDEFGSVVGIVTLEDVLEEIVGEIQDEFDPEMPGPMIRELKNGRFLVQGRTLLEEVEDSLNVEIVDEENDTIGGHVIMKLGRLAKPGDEVDVTDTVRARVARTNRFQIVELILEQSEG